MPKVSVIIPTYNCAQYIFHAVDSVLAQSFRDFELVVVDDGSTDNTRELLKLYGSQIKYIYQQNKDMTAARNTGIKNSSGEYIAFLDSDDIWLAHKLERQVALLDQAPEVGLVYCWHYYIDSAGKRCQFYDNVIGRSFESGSRVYEKLIENNVISGGGSTPVIQRKCLKKSGMFDESIPYSGDWDLWLRISMDYVIAVIPEPLACYRIEDEEHKYPEKFVRYRVDQGLVKVVNKASQLLAERGYKNHKALKRRALVSIHLHCARMWESLGEWSIARSHLLKAVFLDWHQIWDKRMREKLKEVLFAWAKSQQKR